MPTPTEDHNSDPPLLMEHRGRYLNYYFKCNFCTKQLELQDCLGAKNSTLFSLPFYFRVFQVINGTWSHLRSLPIFSLVGRRKHAAWRKGTQHRAGGEPPPPQIPPDVARGAQGGAPRRSSIGGTRGEAAPYRGPSGWNAEAWAI